MHSFTTNDVMINGEKKENIQRCGESSSQMLHSFGDISCWQANIITKQWPHRQNTTAVGLYNYIA